MPEGVVQWFDPATGDGRILHAGRRFAMRAESTEPHARVAGARVHFDIERAGGDVARNVELRAGTRVSRLQRRFGDLTGSATPDAKGTAPFAKAQSGMGRDLQRHPMAVVRQWASLLGGGDLERAMLLYAPDAALHVGGEVLTGPTAIRRHWQTSPLPSGPTPATIGGEDGTIAARWEGDAPDQASLETHLRVAHGEIAEQWLGSVWTITAAEPRPTSIGLSSAGDISEADRAYAVEKIGKVLDAIGAPVLHTSIRLERAADPARELPASARVTVDLDGEPVRAHVAARTIAEAIDRLDGRLRNRLEHIAEHQRARRRRGATSPPGEWRHGDAPSDQPPYFPRPVEERQIVRHKTFTAPQVTIDEAIFDLEAMDYDFFLFTDLARGEDAVVDRRVDGSYGLQHLDGTVPDAAATGAVVEVVDRPAPALTLEQAGEHLAVSDARRVFFKDADTSRGNVLYRRYDGHYGLITPADEVPDGLAGR